MGLRENANSTEWRAITTASLLDNFIQKELIGIVPFGVGRDIIPVGSVEFCAAMAWSQGLDLPMPIDYPADLKPWLGREIRECYADEVPVGHWCKPVETKFFPAQVREAGKPLLNDEGTVLHPHIRCWTTPVIEIANEWRVYVEQGDVVGVAQYDQGDLDQSLSTRDMRTVQTMIRNWKDAPIAYVLDVARVPSGELILIEVNDAWAIGYYANGTMSPRAYAHWLAKRWHSLDVSTQQNFFTDIDFDLGDATNDSSYSSLAA